MSPPRTRVRLWLAVLTVACLPAMAAAAMELVVNDPVPASSLNPFNQMDAVSHRTVIQIYEHLVSLGADGSISPLLAERFEEVAPGVHRFHLKPGVIFHDGRKLTPADVVYSLGEAKKGRNGGLLQLKEVRPGPDAGSVEVVSESPSILSELAFAGFIVPAGSVPRLEERPVGTGPFQMSSHLGGRLELKRFLGYHQPWPAGVPDRLIFESEERDQARRDRLEAGLCQLVTDLNPHLKQNLLAGHGREVRLFSQPSARVFYVVINSRAWPGREQTRQKLSDPRVRRALNLAVDKARLVNVIMLGNGRPLGSCLASAIPGAARSDPYPYDPDQARRLLAEAGAEKLKLRFAYSPERWFGAEYLAKGVARYLNQVGVEVELVPLGWPSFLPTLRREGLSFDLYFWSWGNPILDPAFTIRPLLVDEPFKPWENPAFAHEFAAAQSRSGEARLAAFRAMDVRLHEDAPWIFLFQKIDSYAALRRVDLTTAPTEIFRVFNDVRMK